MTVSTPRTPGLFAQLGRFFGLDRERFRKDPIDSVESLARFAQTRASFIAQSSLFGYLKTRMGTSFRKYFEDEVFSRSIRISAIKVFSSCLSDLTVFAVATAARDGRLDPAESETLARWCYDRGLARHLDAHDLMHVPEGAIQSFAARTRDTDWAAAAEGEAAFRGSALDLVRYAPVIDEYRESDREIVQNSIRFHWRDVRADFRKRVRGEAVAADFRAGGFSDPDGEQPQSR